MITELIVSLVVVLVVVGGYYMWTGTPPGAKLIEEDRMDGTLDEGQATLMFFYAPWCPHCKHATQPWRSFEQLVKNNRYTYGGHTIAFEEINADVDKGRSARYNIDAYPTFKLQTSTKLYQMIGPPTVSNFRSFLQQALGAEKPS